MGYKDYVLEKIDAQRFTYKDNSDEPDLLLRDRSVMDLSIYDGTTFVDKAALQEWIDELESGAYKQIKGALGMWDYTIPEAPCINGYCCLGVQQKTMADKGLLVIQDQADAMDSELGFMIKYGDEDFVENNTLTKVAIKYLGLTVDNPSCAGVSNAHDPILAVWYPAEEEGGGPAVYLTASQLNDTYEMDFNQIAMILRAYL